MTVTSQGYRVLFRSDVPDLCRWLLARDTPAARELADTLVDEARLAREQRRQSFRFYPHPVVEELLDDAIGALP